MAVPSSGQLSLVGIFSEVNEDDYTSMNPDGEQPSLRMASTGGSPPNQAINTNSSSYPNSSAPFQMSEFYGYDHDAAAPWNNNTDWYDSLAQTPWLDTYIKHRIDLGYATTYATNGELADVESWAQDGDIISGATLTYSTSTTTPGYINCDSVGNDCANSYGVGSLQASWNPFLGVGSPSNGTTVFVWFKRHSSTDSMIWCASNGGNQFSLAIKSLSNGKVKVEGNTDNSGTEYAHTITSPNTLANNVWHCVALTTRSFSGSKGSTSAIQGYFRQDNGGSASTMEKFGTEALSSYSGTSKSPPWGIGCTADSASNPSDKFNGDVGLVIVYNYGNFGGTTDSKLNELVTSTESKFGH